MNDKEKGKNEQLDPRDFLRRANPESAPFCSDERQGDGISFNTDNPPELPGATYVVADGIKKILGVSEETAWEMILRANLPLGAHGGPEHHGHDKNKTESIGPGGCGYGMAVETNPDAVGAPEKIPVAQRYARIVTTNGRVYNVSGPHKITHVTIVHKNTFSIDSDEARVAGLGILGCDAWLGEYYADLLNQANPKLPVAGSELTNHIISAMRGVVRILAPDKEIIHIR